MNRKKYRKRGYKKRKLYGKALLGRDKWSTPLLYLSKYKQKGGFFQILAVPYLAKLLSSLSW